MNVWAVVISQSMSPKSGQCW